MTDTIRISEIFGPTIQGEGSVIGEPTIFVRTGGCDYRCSWCDTAHAVDSKYRAQWALMTCEDIWKNILKLSDKTPILVTLSGGNPAIQPLAPLIKMGHAANYRFALETQGSVSQSWFSDLDILTLSPKPPSSKMATDWDMFDQCIKSAGARTDASIKIVIFDDKDYDFAKDCAARYPDIPMILQAGNHTPDEDSADINGITERMRWLIDKTVTDRWFTVRILPQLHVFLWGNKKGV